MLLNYKARNFGSFEDSFEFSMKPIKFMERFEDNIVSFKNKLNISRFAVIAGENAGGKTSFMRSLDFLKFCILESKHMSMLSVLSHKHNLDTSQSFELSVLAEDKIYTYKLELDQYYTVYESLSFRNFNQRISSDKLIFSIKRSKTEVVEITHEDDFDTEDVEIRMNVFANNSFIPIEISTIIQNLEDLVPGSFVNYLYKLNIDIVKPFIEWVENRLIIELPENASLNVYKSMENNSTDLRIMKTKEFLEILKMLDSSIVNIELSQSNVYEKTIIIRKFSNNNELFKIKLEDESSGMRAFFAWAVQLWKVIYKDAVLFADEIDSVLNPILSSKIIAYLRGSEHFGQFVFSTHNVLNLNTRDFMKEQIYFISKNETSISSELYSLKDFKEYRYEKINVYDLYMKGILGGVPNS